MNTTETSAAPGGTKPVTPPVPHTSADWVLLAATVAQLLFGFSTALGYYNFSDTQKTAVLLATTIGFSLTAATYGITHTWHRAVTIRAASNHYVVTLAGGSAPILPSPGPPAEPPAEAEPLDDPVG